MSFEKFKDRGLSGLTNLGNTCFINSCIQVLSHTYELNEFLDQGNFKKRLNKKFDSALLLEWDNLRKLIWSQNCIISPMKFIKTIQKLASLKGQDIFTGFDQNDLPEFLIFLIDCFHNALSRKVEMTIIGNEMNEKFLVNQNIIDNSKNSSKENSIWNSYMKNIPLDKIGDEYLELNGKID